MRIAVLDNTLANQTLLGGLPKAGEHIVNWLARALPEAAFTRIAVADGETLPDPGAHDGYVVGGSEFGVYDETSWMPALRDLLRTLKARGIPVYGICFGHQIMADTFGGRAEKAAGMVVGARDVTVGDAALRLHFWHQDQVTEVPPGARVTARAGHCPICALDYDFPAMSVQFHPELEVGHMTALFERGGDKIIAPELAAAAVASFGGPNDNARVAAEAAVFFRTHLGSA